MYFLEVLRHVITLYNVSTFGRSAQVSEPNDQCIMSKDNASFKIERSIKNRKQTNVKVYICQYDFQFLIATDL